MNVRAPGIELQDGAKFISILAASRLIRRQGDLFAWLKDAQDFLPHQMLIAAWGDFQCWNVKSEVVSHLPGARFTRRCAACARSWCTGCATS